jgi:hypothetical protein
MARAFGIKFKAPDYDYPASFTVKLWRLQLGFGWATLPDSSCWGRWDYIAPTSGKPATTLSAWRFRFGWQWA